MTIPEIRTDRLLLRGWRDEDRPAWAAINADPVVRATLGPVQTRQQADASMDQIVAHWERQGCGLWCVEVGGECIGFTGLNVPSFEAAFTPCVEIGWRLASQHWGNGYAPEAGRVALDFGFGDLGLDEIVSFTALANHNSRRVMEKLGMTHDASADFDHPNVRGPLQRHVLYRIAACR